MSFQDFPKCDKIDSVLYSTQQRFGILDKCPLFITASQFQIFLGVLHECLRSDSNFERRVLFITCT